MKGLFNRHGNAVRPRVAHSRGSAECQMNESQRWSCKRERLESVTWRGSRSPRTFKRSQTTCRSICRHE